MKGWIGECYGQERTYKEGGGTTETPRKQRRMENLCK